MKYFYRILILDWYYLKNHTVNDTSVCFQYWYSVLCLGIATYTASDITRLDITMQTIHIFIFLKGSVIHLEKGHLKTKHFFSCKKSFCSEMPKFVVLRPILITQLLWLWSRIEIRVKISHYIQPSNFWWNTFWNFDSFIRIFTCISMNLLTS